MKALILVGGFGTRLRPLTLTVPKSLVDFWDKPIMVHQIAALAEAGVEEVVLAINYQPEKIKESLTEIEEKYKIKIVCSKEDEPMGTGGPLAIAKDIILENNLDGSFFVLNSDIICNFPFKEMIEFHKQHGKEGTLVTTRVKDPSKFGVIHSDDDGKILDFIEKPDEFFGNYINAGLYLFNTSMLDRIEFKPTSIEREIFPQMAKEEELYALPLKGFWRDIGQPPDFLIGAYMYLEYLESQNDERLAKGKHIIGSVMIHPTAKISENALIGPDVSIGENWVVKAGARIKNSCIFPGTIVKQNSFITGSIIGWSCTIGKWARVEEPSVIAEDVAVGDELLLNGVKILPHKAITKSYYEKGEIIL